MLFCIAHVVNDYDWNVDNSFNRSENIENDFDFVGAVDYLLTHSFTL